MTGMLGSVGRLDGRHDGRQLRHADAGDDARGADRAGADADLDAIGAGIDQRLGAVGGGDIAGDDLDVGWKAASPASTASSTRCEWPCAVSTTRRSTPASISRSARSKPSSPTVVAAATPKPALRVLGGIRVELRLLHVLDGDQADAAILGHRRRRAFRCGDDAAAAWPLPGRPISLDGDQVLAGHQLVDLLAVDRRRSARRDWSGCRPAGPRLAAAAAILDDRNAGDAVGGFIRPAHRPASHRGRW